MAQPQQQYPMPPARAFSPQETPSPSPATPSFVMPPSKRQRLSPNPSSQPGSPYVQSPYAPNAASPGASAPYSAGTSPHFPNVQLPPQGNYNTPYGNGHTTPTLAIPQSQPNHHNSTNQSPLNFPNQNHNQNQNQNQANHPGGYSAYTMPPQGVGAMGPPSKPADKPKEDGLDPTDVLGGTGIDLREEEQYTFQMYNNSFNSQRTGSQSGTISSGHSFTQFPPGDEASFYGAGPANAKAEAANTKSQDEHSAKAAEKAWRDAAFNLAVSRQRELDNPFLHIGAVHQKMEKTAKENGLNLNIDSKGSMGTMKLPGDFPSNTVRTQTATGPNGIIMSTQGNFVPYDSLLVDQLALMSIATKHRLRGLIEDAAKLSKGRQTGSHGVIPDEWADVAAPSSSASAAVEGGPRSGWESAVSPRTNPLKRSFSTANKVPIPVSESVKTPINQTKYSNEVVNTLRQSAIQEREIEEARLRKRNARATGDATPRQGSVIPGTPGTAATELSEKVPTKKEQKKKAEAKVNEAASHAAANVTTAQFLGVGGGLFGKKKKYSWMTGGGPASGASTPGRIMTQGLPGTPAGAAVNAAPERLTAEGARRLGAWREDKEKGKGIQIRDWIAVLQNDGRERKALQLAFTWLDQSEPK